MRDGLLGWGVAGASCSTVVFPMSIGLAAGKVSAPLVIAVVSLAGGGMSWAEDGSKESRDLS